MSVSISLLLNTNCLSFYSKPLESFRTKMLSIRWLAFRLFFNLDSWSVRLPDNLSNGNFNYLFHSVSLPVALALSVQPRQKKINKSSTDSIIGAPASHFIWCGLQPKLDDTNETKITLWFVLCRVGPGCRMYHMKEQKYTNFQRLIICRDRM